MTNERLLQPLPHHGTTPTIRVYASGINPTSPEIVVRDKLAQGHSIEKTTLKIPVYVAYFTAWPDKNGKIEYFGDVYERGTADDFRENYAPRRGTASRTAAGRS